MIDAAGGVVTPGFFATDSVLGAQEVGSLGSDLRISNPALGAAFDVQYGLNPASTLIPVARLGGLPSAIVMLINSTMRGWPRRPAAWPAQADAALPTA
ncbi:hypothetical protein GALL_213790 [mine drainage metagenome]|uniref:Uncharacterized protein n=1 Tax=mine drainage metagenome TaxID=410659 RepID=A0A1J5RX87_9ZZZZ